MRYTKLSLVLVLVMILAGCGQSVPPEKMAYVGQWEAPGMQLLILEDGSVQYERLKGGSTTSVSGPLQEFEGDNFSVGLAFFSTTFVVSEPPYQKDGVWKMVVDDVELTKVR